MIYRDGILRLVLWQPDTGAVVDMSGRDVLGTYTLGSESTGYVSGAGTRERTGLQTTLQFLAMNSEAMRGLQVMAQKGCPVRAAVLGMGLHTNWQQAATLDVVQRRPGASGTATVAASMETHLLHPYVSHGADILDAYTWEAGHAVESSPGVWAITPVDKSQRDGYLFTQSAAPAINLDGSVTPGGPIVLTFQLPVAGARLLFSCQILAGSATATVTGLDWAGFPVPGVVATPGQVLQLTPHVWRLLLSITGTGHTILKPTLEVVSAGLPGVRYRPGSNTPCGTPAAVAPPWTANVPPLAEPEEINAI